MQRASPTYAEETGSQRAGLLAECEVDDFGVFFVEDFFRFDFHLFANCEDLGVAGAEVVGVAFWPCEELVVDAAS